MTRTLAASCGSYTFLPPPRLRQQHSRTMHTASASTATTTTTIAMMMLRVELLDPLPPLPLLLPLLLPVPETSLGVVGLGDGLASCVGDGLTVVPSVGDGDGNVGLVKVSGDGLVPVSGDGLVPASTGGGLVPVSTGGDGVVTGGVVVVVAGGDGVVTGGEGVVVAGGGLVVAGGDGGLVVAGGDGDGVVAGGDVGMMGRGVGGGDAGGGEINGPPPGAAAASCKPRRASVLGTAGSSSCASASQTSLPCVVGQHDVPRTCAIQPGGRYQVDVPALRRYTLH